MTVRLKSLFLIVVLTYPAVCAGRSTAPRRGMVQISGGSFRPLYAPAGQRTVKIASFWIDSVAVSEAQFAAYAKPDHTINAQRGSNHRSPMTNVTWIEAAGYCRARGARLPTTLEWEYVARADEKTRDAAVTSAFKQRALELAVRGDRTTSPIGGGLRNVWGVRDLHGGVAEWTLDFNRNAHAHNQKHHINAPMTCASGTVETGDASDYAAFLRYAQRRTLNVKRSALNLGFRCAA